MPEQWITKLICDAPGDTREGRKFTVSDGRRVVDVILCDEHLESTTLLQALEWGTAARQSAGRSINGATRGLSRQRLDSLVVHDPK